MHIDDFSLPICLIHREKREILDINQAFSTLLGYNKNIIGTEFLMLVEPSSFSIALTIFDKISSETVYLSLPLLDAKGEVVMGSHAFYLRDGVIMAIMIPLSQHPHSQMEHMLLEHLSKPIACIDSSGKCLYANRAAQELCSLSEESNFSIQENWPLIKELCKEKKPFSHWVKFAQKEGFFFFSPLKNNLWLVEYRWGRSEILLRLQEIIHTWEFPTFIIDKREDSKQSLSWNEKFAALSSVPESLVPEIEQAHSKKSHITILHSHGGFGHYKVIFLPFYPQLDIVFGILIDETHHIRKEIVYKRLQEALKKLLYFTEDLQLKLHRGIEAFFETYKLSEREKKLVELIQKGLSNEEISKQLFISLDTVKKNISQLYRKLSVSNRLELLQLIYLPHFRKIPPKG